MVLGIYRLQTRTSPAVPLGWHPSEFVPTRCGDCVQPSIFDERHSPCLACRDCVVTPYAVVLNPRARVIKKSGLNVRCPLVSRQLMKMSSKPIMRQENFLNFDLLRSCRKVGNASLAGEIRDVRFGSLADIRERISDVCFTPERGYIQRRSQCPLSAISGLAALSDLSCSSAVMASVWPPRCPVQPRAKTTMPRARSYWPGSNFQVRLLSSAHEWPGYLRVL